MCDGRCRRFPYQQQSGRHLDWRGKKIKRSISKTVANAATNSSNVNRDKNHAIPKDDVPSKLPITSPNISWVIMVKVSDDVINCYCFFLCVLMLFMLRISAFTAAAYILVLVGPPLGSSYRVKRFFSCICESSVWSTVLFYWNMHIYQLGWQLCFSSLFLIFLVCLAEMIF